MENSIPIIVAFISGILTLIGVIISNIFNAKKIKNDILYELDKQQAIFKVQLDELTREVRQHNKFAERIPKIEASIENLTSRVNRIEKK